MPRLSRVSTNVSRLLCSVLMLAVAGLWLAGALTHTSPANSDPHPPQLAAAIIDIDTAVAAAHADGDESDEIRQPMIPAVMSRSRVFRSASPGAPWDPAPDVPPRPTPLFR